MEKYWIWYALQLKAWCRTKICWMQVIGMLFVVYVIMHITLPSQDNIQVGICNSTDGYAAEISELLLQEESVFIFTEYADEGSLREDIADGTIECGFVFSDDFEQRFSGADIEGCVKYMETPFTTKGKIARETFFASFFRVYGRILLQEEVPNIFQNKQQKMREMMLEKNREYREGDKVFSVETENVAARPGGQVNGDSAGVYYPVQGCVGIFLFAILLLAYGRSFEESGRVKNALSFRDKYVFEYLNYLAAGTAALAAGLAAVVFAGESRGIVTEGGRMLLFLLVGSFWILLVGRLWRNRVAFSAWTATLVMVQFFIYPVFADFSEYVPLLRYARWLFPLAAYL